MSTQWYFYKNEEQKGPYSWDGLKEQVVKGQLERDDLVWSEGMEDWTLASNVRDLFEGVTAPPPPPASQSDTASAPIPPPPSSQAVAASTPPHAPQQPAVKKRSGIKLALIIAGSLMALFIVVIVIAVFAARTTLVNSIVYEEALKELRESSEASEIMGVPIEAGSSVNGSINVSNGRGDAELAIPVSGPLNNGDLLVEGILSGGQWQLTYLELETGDGQRLDLMAAKEAAEVGEVAEEVAEEIAEEVAGALEMFLFSSPKYGFEMLHPEDWLVLRHDGDDEGFSVTFASNIYYSDISNFIDVNPMKTAAFGGVYRDLDELLEAMRIDFQETGSEEVYFDRDSDLAIGDKFYNYFVIRAITPIQDTDHLAISLAIERDSEYLYQILYVEPVDVPHDFVSYKDEMLDSFQFIPMQ